MLWLYLDKNCVLKKSKTYVVAAQMMKKEHIYMQFSRIPFIYFLTPRSSHDLFAFGPIHTYHQKKATRS